MFLFDFCFGLVGWFVICFVYGCLIWWFMFVCFCFCWVCLVLFLIVLVVDLVDSLAYVFVFAGFCRFGFGCFG